jgi:hypothetical protein
MIFLFWVLAKFTEFLLTRVKNAGYCNIVSLVHRKWSANLPYVYIRYFLHQKIVLNGGVVQYNLLLVWFSQIKKYSHADFVKPDMGNY